MVQRSSFLLVFARAGQQETADQTPCADYISGGPDNPASGTLKGSRKVTKTASSLFRVGMGFDDAC